jgi:hypothetical protein
VAAGLLTLLFELQKKKQRGKLGFRRCLRFAVKAMDAA